MSSKHRIVVFRKHGSEPDELVCDFAYEDVWAEDVKVPATIDIGELAKVGGLGERVYGYLGGDPTGAEVLARDVVALSRADRMVEVWRRPSAFKAERLNGMVIRGYVYRWRASVADVLGEGN